MKPDDIAKQNQRLFTEWAGDGCEYTQAWLDLKADLLHDYVEGRMDVLPEPYSYIYPRAALENVKGKDVLCLASGGGQQSAVFGLLGAKVTSLDLTEVQLEEDRKAAEHHGYDIDLVQGDMRDLSDFDDESFDLVYQAISIVFVPDVHPVYRDVYRVLKPGGRYRVGHVNPATQPMDETAMADGAYLLSCPYQGGEIQEAEGREFRHTLGDIFNALIETGFGINGVWEDPRHFVHNLTAEPGSEPHMLSIIQKYFAILAGKPKRGEQ